MASTETDAGAPIARSPIARSPIARKAPVRAHAGWEVSAARSEGALRLSDLTPLSKVLVRGAPGSTVGQHVGCAFGSTRRDADGSLVVGTGPDEWLILSPAGSGARVTAALEGTGGAGSAGGGLITVIDMTHGSVVLRIAGANAHRVLEKLCAIDLSDRVTPNGSCFSSSVARLRSTVIRDDLGPERSYLIESDRSSGQYLFDAILDAGAELTIDVDGYPEKEI